MKVSEIANRLDMKLLSGDPDREISGVYTCDLLSWVISHAAPGDLWVTVMNNINVIAVASLADVGCVVIPENVEVYDGLIERADQKEVTLLSTEMTAAEVIIKVNRLLEDK